MRSWLSGVLVLLVFLSGCITQLKPEGGVCEAKMDLSKGDIDKFDNISRSYIQSVEGSDYNELMKHFSSQLKEALNDHEVEGMYNLMKTGLGHVNKIELYEIFRVTGVPESRAFCSSTSDVGDVKNNYWVYVPAGETKYVLTVHLIDSSLGEKLYGVVGLVEEDGEWKIWSMHFQPASVAGISSEEFFKLAESEKQKGNEIIAIFYNIIGSTTYLNNQYVESFFASNNRGKITDMVEDVNKRGVYDEWTTDSGQKFKVYSIVLKQAKDEGRPITLINLKYITDDLEDKEAVGNESIILAKHFKNKFTGYDKVFWGVVVTAAEKIPEPGETVDAYNNRPFA